LEQAERDDHGSWASANGEPVLWRTPYPAGSVVSAPGRRTVMWMGAKNFWSHAGWAQQFLSAPSELWTHSTSFVPLTAYTTKPWLSSWQICCSKNSSAKADHSLVLSRVYQQMRKLNR